MPEVRTPTPVAWRRHSFNETPMRDLSDGSATRRPRPRYAQVAGARRCRSCRWVCSARPHDDPIERHGQHRRQHRAYEQRSRNVPPSLPKFTSRPRRCQREERAKWRGSSRSGRGGGEHGQAAPSATTNIRCRARGSFGTRPGRRSWQRPVGNVSEATARLPSSGSQGKGRF
jgi:hypothetical protein